jgi:hypothetical protein
VSVVTDPSAELPSGSISEQRVRSRPGFGRLESTRLRHVLDSLELAYARSLATRLERVIDDESVAAVHSVAHGLDFVAAHRVARRRRIPFLLTVQDHPAYTFGATPTRQLGLRRLAAPWREAQQRYVISDELGDDLCRRYGTRSYTVVTDGIVAPRAATVDAPVGPERHVYFMGAFHLSYRENLVALLHGLARYRDQHGAPVSLVLRGGGPPGLSDEERAGVPVTTLPWGSQADVEADLKRAGLVYVPLPFGSEHRLFVRFSLSTKLVTFLGSGVPILYHGPDDAAAGRLLGDAGAAIAAHTLEPEAIATALSFEPDHARAVVRAASELARDRFLLEKQRCRFWQPIVSAQQIRTCRDDADLTVP